MTPRVWEDVGEWALLNIFALSHDFSHIQVNLVNKLY